MNSCGSTHEGVLSATQKRRTSERGGGEGEIGRGRWVEEEEMEEKEEEEMRILC